MSDYRRRSKYPHQNNQSRHKAGGSAHDDVEAWGSPDPTPQVTTVEELPGEELNIVSISDIHGYLDAARRALTAVGATDRFAPMVKVDADGRLHWADNDYVLVFNGDLVDRGPESHATIGLAFRLMMEAPPGRVRYHLGNHEMAILLPKKLPWPGTYTSDLNRGQRKEFLNRVAEGLISVSFKGYEYTYSHAGSNAPFDMANANRSARDEAEELLSSMETGEYATVQDTIPIQYETVFGLDDPFGRGPDAGLLWMDLEHMPPTAPPQIVGHTKQPKPTRVGNVVCESVIRQNREITGGEAVLIETPEDLVAVRRTRDGSVSMASV